MGEVKFFSGTAGDLKKHSQTRHAHRADDSLFDDQEHVVRNRRYDPVASPSTPCEMVLKQALVDRGVARRHL